MPSTSSDTKHAAAALGAEQLFGVVDGVTVLRGTRCEACTTWYFPPETVACRNPACGSKSLVGGVLDGRGTVWAATDARYRPPAPFVSDDEFQPFAIVAVELEHGLVVLGQADDGVTVDQLRAGTPVELVTGVLFEDDERVHTVWKWRPVAGSAT